MTTGNCANAATKGVDENPNSTLRQSMQHEMATEHLSQHCKPHGSTATEHARRPIIAVSLHCKLSLALLLHSYANLELEKKHA